MSTSSSQVIYVTMNSSVEMNGIPRKKAETMEKHMEKQIAGCLGRVVNLFDLNTGVAANKLLTDKPYCDGSSLSRSRSDMARMLSLPFVDQNHQIEDKLIVSELKRNSSNKKTNRTPIKTLIAQEMSKEVEPKHGPPNLVAKLMGLDTLPQNQFNSAAEKSHFKGYSRRSKSHSGSLGEWDQDNDCQNEKTYSDVHRRQEQNEYKDIYEIWQKSRNTNHGKDSPPQKGRVGGDNLNEKKMALVRQKFMEAKRLATDEHLRQSKEFQEALEVLSSNKELFLKFLQEPNSMYPQNLYALHAISSPEMKRITVLKPSGVVDNDKLTGPRKKNEKHEIKPVMTTKVNGLEKSSSVCSPVSTGLKVDEHHAQPTRIVVLKPKSGKNHDVLLSTSPSSVRVLYGENFDETSEGEDSEQLAKEITMQMRENVNGHRRDETLLSSVFSNGYIGDDSSFNKSENECVVENLSDSEVMSPTSKHSWDYINRVGSPYSFSSFSRPSCSPESSVCREAKKRLSERWAMVALNGSLQEQQRHARRSSSTLGEMLSFSDTKKTGISEEFVEREKEAHRGSTSVLPTSTLSKDEGIDDSPKGLPRCKSLPVSSSFYGSTNTLEVLDNSLDKKQEHELTKAKSMKSSFKGKVSSLFFSRSKKSSKEKVSTSQVSDGSQFTGSETLRSSANLPAKNSNDMSQCNRDSCSPPTVHVSPTKTSSVVTTTRSVQNAIYLEECLSAKPVMSCSLTENQDQPSPNSVLEAPFEEYDHKNLESSRNLKTNQKGLCLPLKSNLIDKSPPIESISRTLSWDDSCAVTATPYLSKVSSIEEKEQDWHSFVQTLITEAGFNIEMQSDTFFSRWYSPESPLNPLLRVKYENVSDKETFHEAKRRQQRSIQKLIFDGVNAALAEIASYDKRADKSESLMVVEFVWDQMKEWLASEVRYVLEDGSGGGGDFNSLVVERVVTDEVVGKCWTQNMIFELNNIDKDIEGKLLEELVDEVVLDFTGK